MYWFSIGILFLCILVAFFDWMDWIDWDRFQGP